MSILSRIKDILCLNTESVENKRMLSKEIFREYDIRGIVGRSLFFEDAYSIGRAFAAHIIKKGLKTISVGYDCRLSSYKLYKNLVKGLVNSGAHVISLGLVHTPLLYYSVNKLNSDAGIMITGSHNPVNYNGFKFMLGLDPFYGEDIRKLEDMILQRDFINGVGREIIMNNIFAEYIDDLLKDFNFSDDLKIAWDVGNGAVSNAIKAITARLPGKHHVLFEEMDGTFPNRPPDPSIPQNLEDLSKFVVYNEFDIGFAFDSDGDRLGVVDASGKLLYSDQVLSVLARDFLKKNPGAQVIADVKSCNRVFETIKECGGIGLMERVGHSFIKAKMKKNGVLLAGEMSGHFFFKDRWFGFDDGIYAALRCMELISNDKNAFNNLDYGFVSPEIRISCSESKKFKIIDAIKEKLKKNLVQFSEIDGVRVSTDIGWWLLRTSNTQNAVSLRMEAYSPELMEDVKKQVISYLKEYIPDIGKELKKQY